MAVEIFDLAQNGAGGNGTGLALTVPVGGVAQYSRVAVLIAIPGNAEGGITVEDDRENTYAADGGIINVTGGARIALYSAPITTALLEGDTITITVPTCPRRAALALMITGLVGGGALDQVNQAAPAGLSGTPSAGSITSTAAGAILAAVALDQDQPPDEISTMGGWSIGLSAEGDDLSFSIVGVYPTYQVGAAGTYTHQITLNHGGQCASVIASYIDGEEPDPEPEPDPDPVRGRHRSGWWDWTR